MQKSKLQFKIQKLLIVIVFIFLATPVLAAEISFDAKTSEIAVGQQFQAGVILNTDGEEINAVEGKIIFPSEFLKLKEIRDANSIVSFWIDKPKLESDGQIAFSGIIPGGYRGSQGLLLTLIFVSKKEGGGTIELRNAKTLLNDGNGTEASLTISNFQFIISSLTASAPTSQIPPSETKDTESPESFVPEIGQNPTIFNGKWFLVFSTQDKRSGIDHYEVKEVRQKIFGIFSKWVTAESPYLLEDQELRSHVFVKAVDKAGNMRIEKISPQNPLRWYENYENWLIIILGLAVAYAIQKFLWRKYLRK